MEFGFGLPTRGPMATPQSLATLARTGEELGFAIISVSDHIIIPKAINSTYPYNESGTFAGSPSGECLEQLSLLSFLVGVTSSALPCQATSFVGSIRGEAPQRGALIAP